MAFATHADSAVFSTGIDERFAGLEHRAVEAITAAVSNLRDQLGTLVTDGWTSANNELNREQVVQEMKAALEATSMEGLLQASKNIQTIDVDRDTEKVVWIC